MPCIFLVFLLAISLAPSVFVRSVFASPRGFCYTCPVAALNTLCLPIVVSAPRAQHLLGAFPKTVALYPRRCTAIKAINLNFHHRESLEQVETTRARSWSRSREDVDGSSSVLSCMGGNDCCLSISKAWKEKKTQREMLLIVGHLESGPLVSSHFSLCDFLSIVVRTLN